ncbi:uncharacterized protein ATNIH1004_010614 [Aspergillus tanneri]|uniref:Uncharacterized protein n=1 Tax=Aspergillus tanneri TaxID=1220188 RepID=A0A5M9MH92_9EURO|nr:uncharacterized protein ATNIH1004_010614 [Aspergillus tanneri]KAA8643839.1 hypothetical protein ATNIH1004_010614 [Aspergillus tanneri]
MPLPFNQNKISFAKTVKHPLQPAQSDVVTDSFPRGTISRHIRIIHPSHGSIVSKIRDPHCASPASVEHHLLRRNDISGPTTSSHISSIWVLLVFILAVLSLLKLGRRSRGNTTGENNPQGKIRQYVRVSEDSLDGFDDTDYPMG